MRHLLVTNDFPPKVGGIQSYLWALWSRLPADDVAVYTTSHPDAEEFDVAQGFRIVRDRRSLLLPGRALARRIDRLADEVGAELVILDPVLPLGIISRWLTHPYGLIVHGAEMTVSGRLPGHKQLAGSVLRGASTVVCSGGYPAGEARHAAGIELPVLDVPPGVDVERFVPLEASRVAEVRSSFGLPPDGRLVLTLSRLVPRKGMDVVLEACGLLGPGRNDLTVAVAGDGRDRARLERIAQRAGAPVQFLGSVPEADLPALYGCADIFAMVCRDRWFGLEQEGFGIVFLEAAACGLPVIAGRSGGSHEAVADRVSGVVLDDPRSVEMLAVELGRLLADTDRAAEMGRAGRARAAEEFNYDLLAQRLNTGLDAVDLRGRPAPGGV